MNPADFPENAEPLVLIARAAADANRIWIYPSGPAALVLDQVTGRVLRVSPASELSPDFLLGDVATIVLSDAVLLPGFVNAHTHLDLTDIGPRPHDPRQGFMPWIDMVRHERPTDDASIAAAVKRGASLCLAGGTAAVGDIAGAPRGTPSTVPYRTLAEAPISSVSYLEYFAIGHGLERGIDAITRAGSLAGTPGASPRLGNTRLGLQPHAPNTVSARGYEHALALSQAFGDSFRRTPVCTHLAETPEEREFIAHARGPQRTLLETLGLWNDSLAAEIGKGLSPIEHLAPILESASRFGVPFTAVHCNDVSDADLDILARTGARVVYCPRASDYFAAPVRLGPHRYRDMLARGIPVALGTDSIINLPPETADPEFGSISILDEMRFLHRRDRVDVPTLFSMATLHGAAAIDAPAVHFQLTAGAAPLSVLAIDISDVQPRRSRTTSGVDPRSWVLDSESPSQLVWTRKSTV